MIDLSSRLELMRHLHLFMEYFVCTSTFVKEKL